MGDLVYSVDKESILAVPITRVRRVPVHHHSVLEILLAGGRKMEISPLHPTAEGAEIVARNIWSVLKALLAAARS